jgi:hypothetical protein
MKNFLISAFIAVAAVAITGCSSGYDPWTEPVIPVTLRGIEAVNIDNAGQFPQITVQPIKKDAYMLGIRWVVDNIPTENDVFITGPIREGEQTFGTVADGYQKAIKCLTPFSDGIPAGTYVSKFFKEIGRNYLPRGINEGFVLLVAPDAGTHSFRVEYHEVKQGKTTLKFYYDTPPVEFF